LGGKKKKEQAVARARKGNGPLLQKTRDRAGQPMLRISQNLSGEGGEKERTPGKHEKDEPEMMATTKLATSNWGKSDKVGLFV